MNEVPKKRRGPIELFKNSRRFRFAVLALTLVPVLYVLSSGPARSLSWTAIRSTVITTPGAPGQTTVVVQIPDWWTKAYAPLWWIASQPWGEALVWGYWELFPIGVPSDDGDG